MIVLRFTIGQTTQEVRTPKTDVVVGSAPTADVTLFNAGLPGHAFRLRREETEVQLEVLGSERRLTLRVGDIIEVDGVGIALIGLLPADQPDLPAFGGYDDDLGAAAPGPFVLADEKPAPDVTAPSKPPDEPAFVVSGALPPSEATRRRQRRRAAMAAAGTGAQAAGTTSPEPPPQLTWEEKAAELKPLRFPDPNFGTELVNQLKRSPFFAMSLGFHLLVFLILFLFDTSTNKKPLRDGPGAVTAALDATDDELHADVPELLDDGLPLEQMNMPDLPEELELEDDPTPKKELPPPPSPFREEEEDEIHEPPQMGIMPGLRAASIRMRKRKPKMELDLKQTFTKGGAGSSNQQSAEVVRAALGRGRYGNGAKLEDLKKEDILVVAGSFDHIHRVLDALRVKYVRKAPWGLIQGKKPDDFSSYKIVFWNCGESLRRHRMVAIGKRLKEFVRRGGYLFTTDWGVANVLPYAFPGYLKTNGNRAHLPEMVLTIEPARSARSHPLLEGVFHEGVKGKWWLEQASFDMSVGRKDAVTILIECPMLADQFNRSPAVAATFHYGRGRVLHTLGHYYQEAGNLAGTMSAHRLALNFVLMRLDQDRKPRR